MATADEQYTPAAAQQLVWHLGDALAAKLAPTCLTVGLSGGPDSTLLLYLCRELCHRHARFTLKAVHCIHGLDADDPLWLAHCRRLCSDLAVPLTVKRLNIVYKNRESPEDSSRQERYRALLAEVAGGCLCLGHQADDNCENFFLALKRGSGPQGLAGMALITRDARGIIARPLLTLSRAQVEALTLALKLPTVFDISNTYLKFERNFVRLQLLPLMQTRFPKIKAAVARSQELCALEHDLAMRFIEPQFHKRYDPARLCLDCSALDFNDEHLCLLLMRRFCQCVLVQPPELSRLRAALQLMQGTHGAVGCIALAAGWTLRRFMQALYLVPSLKLPVLNAEQRADGIELTLGQTLTLGDFSYRLLKAEDASTDGFYLSAPQLQLRFAPPGQLRLKPQGRAHQRELKKLYTEYAIPSWLRPALPLLCDDAEVVGLAAAFNCARAKGSGDKYTLTVDCGPLGRSLHFARAKREAGV